MHSSPFTVAGMSSSTSSHHSPNLNSWGASSTSTLGDSLSQSRSHYQSGYLMSTSQSNTVPQGNQRIDEVPVVPTKAKMNQILSRGSTTDFGMDSMFQSSRQRQTLADEDAPPMSSINDIPNEINVDPSPGHFQPRKTATDFSSSRRQMPTGSSMSQQTVYVIVFGYPPDKYSVTVEYFKSLGNSTDADPHTEIANCFKIGYSDAGDAMRAVRKNGEILGGSFMVGAKWADPSQAEGLLGQPVHRTTFSSSVSPSQNHIESPSHSPFGNSMAVDEPYSSNTPTVGTPIKLVPSASAFRKINAGGLPSSKPATPQPKWGSNAQAPAGSASGLSNGNTGTPGVQPSPSKGMIGQVSDLIFGW